MSTRPDFLPLAHAALAAALLTLLPACDGKKNAQPAPPPPPEVIVATPVERDVVVHLTYTGVIEASETVELRARVQGFLEKVNFEAGQRVRAGDVLFEIDPRQHSAAVNQAKAQVRANEAALLGAENDARLARELADQRAGPEIDAIIKSARRDAAAAELERSKAQLEEAELNLEFCTVKAPIDGRIGENDVDAGNLVGRSEPTLLAEIVKAAPAYIPVDISESDVLTLLRERDSDRAAGAQTPDAKGRACEASLAGESDFRFKGRVDFIDPKMDSATGTLRVRTRFENEDESLVPGLFARVRFPMSTRKSLLVPDAALISDQLGRYAMVVNAKDEVEVRRVTIGALEADMRVVETGLAPADRVIVLGVLKARPGAKVAPKLQEPAAPSR